MDRRGGGGEGGRGRHDRDGESTPQPNAGSGGSRTWERHHDKKGGDGNGGNGGGSGSNPGRGDGHRGDHDGDHHRDRGHRRDGDHHRRNHDYSAHDATRIYESSNYGNYQYSSNAYDQGYRDGLYTGANDARRGQPYDPQRSHFYRRPGSGYHSTFGNRGAYEQAYLDGFLRGYEEGYQHYDRYFVNGHFQP